MGHLGVAVGATRISAKAPLWVLLFASALPDLADAFGGFIPWHAFITEYSHTLYGIAVLAVLMAAVGAVATRGSRPLPDNWFLLARCVRH